MGDPVLLELTNSSLQFSNPFPDTVRKLFCKQSILGHVHLPAVKQLLHTILKQNILHTTYLYICLDIYPDVSCYLVKTNKNNVNFCSSIHASIDLGTSKNDLSTETVHRKYFSVCFALQSIVKEQVACLLRSVKTNVNKMHFYQGPENDT